MKHDRIMKASLLGAAAFCLAFSAAQAQNALSDTDRTFIDQAAKGGYAEVAMGKTASESKNEAVSSFGKQMIEEHGKANEELAMLAKQKGVEPPTGPDLGSKAKNALAGVLPGKTFDKQYVSSQLDDHKETLALFQKQAQNGQDADLKTFATKGIPMIQHHIDELEQLQTRPEMQ